MSVEIKTIIDDIANKQRAAIAESTQVKSAIEKLASEQHVIAERMQKLEQRSTSREDAGALDGGVGAIGGLAHELRTNSRFKSLREGDRGTVSAQFPINIKALTSTQNGPAGGEKYSVHADRMGGISGVAVRPLTLLDVLPSQTGTSNRLEFAQVTGGFTFNAGYQLAEGDAKPEQLVPTQLVSVPYRQIAAFTRLSRQVWSDDSTLPASISNLLLYAIARRSEIEIVTGAGTAGTVSGLVTAATALTTTGAQADRLSSAQAQLASSGWSPNLVILNPTDWHEIRSERGTDQTYVAGSWNQPSSPEIWGMQVISTPSIAVNTAIVMDTSQCSIVIREQGTVTVSSEDASNFTTNMLTVLAEMRLGLAIYAPSAIGRVTLSP